jgi:beta-galactosidase GanA
MVLHAFEENYDFYPYGVQYHRAPTPLPEEWDGDLNEIKRAGFTHVQYRPQWRWHERIRGKAVWDDLDRLFDLANENDLRVILKPMLETAPDWVFQELNGTRIGFQGIPLTPVAHGAYYVGGWLPCFDNPQVIEAASAFVRELVQRYHNHPALWFYDAWNEPVSRPMGQCQCPHSIESYRRWLQSRYGTIEQLNAYFGKAWTSYETLRPPDSADDYTEMFLWRQWAGHAVSEQVRFVADAIRSVDPKAFVMVHIGASSVIQDSVWATSDDLLNSKMTDRYGTSFWIPLHPETPIEDAQPDYQSDWIRRVDPMYWCHEFYPNHGEWCVPPEPKVLSRLIWLAIAGGAAGFTYWQYRAERFGNETNGFGLRNIDGTPTPRSEIADEIGQVLKHKGTKLVGTRRVPSPVAMLYSRESDLILRIQEIQSSWKNGGLAHENGTVEYSYKRALMAAHALYVGNGQSVEWVVPGDDLSGIRLLHVTCAEMIDETAASWLKQFVEQGGTLVVEFPFACRDGRTWVAKSIPNHGLDALLGCREIDRVVTGSESLKNSVTFNTGQIVLAKRWRIELLPTTAKPIAYWNDGCVAAVQHTFGKGMVICSGVNLALSFADTKESPEFDLYRWILSTAGLPCDEGGRNVWIRKRRSINREIWFIFNMTENDQTLTLPALPGEVWYGQECTLNGNEIIMKPNAVWVGEIPLV